jgi:hypothetical protein
MLSMTAHTETPRELQVTMKSKSKLSKPVGVYTIPDK